jgi:hypothetical protein
MRASFLSSQYRDRARRDMKANHSGSVPPVKRPPHSFCKAGLPAIVRYLDESLEENAPSLREWQPFTVTHFDDDKYAKYHIATVRFDQTADRGMRMYAGAKQADENGPQSLMAS